MLTDLLRALADDRPRTMGELAGELGDEAHALNPGTTADLVAASIFVFLTEGGMLADVPALTARW